MTETHKEAGLQSQVLKKTKLLTSKNSVRDSNEREIEE